MADGDIGALAIREADGLPDGGRVVVCLRPEEIELSRDRPNGGGTILSGQVRAANFLGEVVDVRVDVGGHEIKVRHRRSPWLERGRTVYLAVPPEACTILQDD